MMERILLGALASVVIGLSLWVHGYYQGRHVGDKKLSDYVTKQEKAVTGTVQQQEKIIYVEVEKEVEKIVYRDKFITKIQKEIEYVSQLMVSCPVSVDAVRVWNQIRSCSLFPSESTCQTDSGMPDAGSTSGTGN